MPPVSGVFALSAFWFLYMGAIGLFFPYYALYLGDDAALTGVEVGAIMATVPLVGLVAPAFWGRIADRTGASGRVLAIAVVGGAFAQTLLGLADGFLPILLATALAAAFSSATMPLGVSVSLDVLGELAVFRFGRVRVWGTIGYLASVVGFPLVLRTARAGGSDIGLGAMFPAAAVLMLASAVALRSVASAGGVPEPRRSDWRELLHHPAFLRMLAFAFLAYLFLQGPISLFAMWVRSRGGGVDEVSLFWIVMLLPEIPLMILAGPGLRRFGARTLLAGGVCAGGIRWLACGFVEDPFWIYAVQLLHGAVVTGLLVGGPLYVDAAVPPALRATAQGVLAMAGVGVGGIVSSLATGWLHDRVGPDAPYWIGGGGALALAALVRVIVPLPGEPFRGRASSP